MDRLEQRTPRADRSEGADSGKEAEPIAAKFPGPMRAPVRPARSGCSAKLALDAKEASRMPAARLRE